MSQRRWPIASALTFWKSAGLSWPEPPPPCATPRRSGEPIWAIRAWSGKVDTGFPKRSRRTKNQGRDNDTTIPPQLRQEQTMYETKFMQRVLELSQLGMQGG